MSKNIAQEMPTGSKRNVQLNKEWEASFNNLSQMTREYTFIASPHDWQVPNYDSTLPELTVEQRSRVTPQYVLVPGHGHNSIVDAVSKIVAGLICPTQNEEQFKF